MRSMVATCFLVGAILAAWMAPKPCSAFLLSQSWALDSSHVHKTHDPSMFSFQFIGRLQSSKNNDKNWDHDGIIGGYSDYGDFNSSSFNNVDGEELAKNFYQEVRQREKQEEEEEDKTSRNGETAKPIETQPRSVLSEEEAKRLQNDKPFSRRREISVASSTRNNNQNNNSGNESFDATTSKQKYTGRSNSPLFGNEPPGTRQSISPRQEILEREFQVAGRGASLGLGLQAGIALLALLFYIYVGLSGGIVSGGPQDYGGDDWIEFEQVIPVPRDTEKSVWL